MSLKLWLPLNGNLDNQGLSSAVITNYGATVNTSGKIGSCYSFDGSDDYISIDYSELYKIFKGGPQQFTIAFWIYHADTTRAIIFGDYNLAGTIGFNIELTTEHQIRFYWNGSPDKKFAAATAIAASEWTHIVLTYDGSKINIYKNGILQLDSWSGTLVTKNKTSGLFYLGRDSRTGATALNGKINDFRIYDTALSPREIKEIAKGLVLHYTLSGPSPEQLFGEVTEDNVIYSIRQSPDKHSAFDSIVGASVVWNQLSKINSMAWPSSGYRGITITKVDDATLHVSGTATANAQARAYYNATSLIARQGHVFYAKSGDNRVQIYIGNGSSNSELITRPSTISENVVFFFIPSGSDLGTNGIDIKPQIIDLTTALPSAIVDYIMTITPMADRVAWLKRYFMLDKDYPYSEPTFKHVEGLVEYRTVGFNQWDGQWEVGEIYSKTGENRTNSARSRSKNFIPVIPDTVYYHYGTPMAIDLYDQSKNFIIQIGGFYEDRKFTTPSNCYYIKFFVNTNTMPSNICINISDSSKNGTYEPYVSHSYSYTNPPTLRGVYRLDENNNLFADGDVWNSNGTVSRNYAVMVLDGTNQKFTGTFGLQDSGNYVVYKTMPVNRTPYTLCDRFVYSTQGISVMPLYSYVSSSGAATTWSFALPNTITSLDEANAWLVNNPVTIVYKKATPTIETATKYTNPQIIEPNGTESYNFTGLIPPGHITKYVDVQVEGGNYTYDESLTNMGMTDNIEYDVSGYGRNGVKNGNIISSSDTERYAVSSVFDGSSAYIETDPLPPETKTVSVWVKTSWASSSGYKFVFHDKGTGLAIGFSDTRILTYVGDSNGGTGSAVQTSGKYLANEWNHIVVIKTGDKTRTVYVNGEQMPTTSNNYWGGDINKLLIGVRHSGGNYKNYINGQISDFRAYVTELSEDDILALYHTPISLANDGTLLTQGEYVEV